MKYSRENFERTLITQVFHLDILSTLLKILWADNIPVFQLLRPYMGPRVRGMDTFMQPGYRCDMS